MLTKIYSFQFIFESNGSYKMKFSCPKIPDYWQITYRYNRTYFCFVESAAPVYKGDQVLFSMCNLALMYAEAVYQIRHVFQ